MTDGRLILLNVSFMIVIYMVFTGSSPKDLYLKIDEIIGYIAKIYVRVLKSVLQLLQ